MIQVDPMRRSSGSPRSSGDLDVVTRRLDGRVGGRKEPALGKESGKIVAGVEGEAAETLFKEREILGARQVK